jgi:hypothetical protein
LPHISLIVIKSLLPDYQIRLCTKEKEKEKRGEIISQTTKLSHSQLELECDLRKLSELFGENGNFEYFVGK